MRYSFKSYYTEPINRLLILLIVTFVSIILFNFSFRYLSYFYYEKPTRAKIKNQLSKAKLAKIINRDLLLLENDFLLFTSSGKDRYVTKLYERIAVRVSDLNDNLVILEKGGLVKDKIEVNIFNKDTYVDIFEYRKTVTSNNRQGFMDLSARLKDIVNLSHVILDLKSSYMYVGVLDLDESNYKLSYYIKKSRALVQRSKEIVNSIYTNVVIESNNLEEEVHNNTRLINNITLIVDIVLGVFCLAFSWMIFLKINSILEKNKKIVSRNIKTNESLRAIIDNMPVGVILVDMDKNIVQINEEAAKILKFNSYQDAKKEIIGTKCNEIFCKPLSGKCAILDNGEPFVAFSETKLVNNVTLLKSVIPITIDDNDLLMEVFIDISERIETEKKLKQETLRANKMAGKAIQAEDMLKEYNEKLEDKVKERTISLEKAVKNLKNAQTQLVRSEKLVSVGQLASGIAHEINTPVQFIGDNIQFLVESFQEFERLFSLIDDIAKKYSSDGDNEWSEQYENAKDDVDLEYFLEEIPVCLNQTIEGVERVASIVHSMKSFSHPGNKERMKVDINAALSTTMVVSRNEWKYYADIETVFDCNLPETSCFPGELNQVFLNLLTNAAHAIADTEGYKTGNKGTIKIVTRQDNDKAIISISDTGRGIPEHLHSKIFDPFFTTKEVGKGTGQGLSISHSVIVEQHGGDLFFETSDSGTTFHIHLPING